MKRKLCSLAILFSLIVSLVSVPAAANDKMTIDYVSLGDSLAAGVLSDKTLGDSFSDYTATYFGEMNILDSYTKAFAKARYTTNDILADLTTKVEVQEAIKKANVISISAGANDILKLANIDLASGMITLNPTLVPDVLKSISENYAKIISTIRTLNPDAHIFVTGYYFAFPSAPEGEMKKQLLALTQQLNTVVEQTVGTTDAIFVPIFDAFGGTNTETVKTFVPNPLDIHPNAAGYKEMSTALLEAISKQVAFEQSPEPELPTPIDVPEDLVNHWAKEEMLLLLQSNFLKVDQEGKIYPNKEITRAEVATILYQAFPRTTVVPENPNFKDVPESHPAYMAIAVLTEAGIFAKGDQFNPDHPITRVQLAKVTALSFGLQQVGNPVVFKDVSTKYWAYDYIQALATNKIMIGTKAGAFNLHSNMKRAEFAVVVTRLLKSKGILE